MNTLLHETASVEVYVGLPGYCTKKRVQPTLAAVLDSLRLPTRDIRDHHNLSAIKGALCAEICAERWGVVYDAIGKLLGLPPAPGEPTSQNGNGTVGRG